MIYLDTSLVVAALTNEQATINVQNWLGRQSIADLIISDWTVTEVSAALSTKVRTKELSQAARQAAALKFEHLASTDFRKVPITAAHFAAAANFAHHDELGLRAGDALHLAVAADHQTTVFSLDRRLISAGPKLGVPTRSPLTHT